MKKKKQKLLAQIDIVTCNSCLGAPIILTLNFKKVSLILTTTKIGVYYQSSLNGKGRIEPDRTVKAY